jgi:radical SAM protein with 4Fe4S-binding SPASM domain
MAHPTWGGTNDFYPLRGPRIIPLFEFLAEFGARKGVDVGFDCGFTPCMFSPGFVNAHEDMFIHPEARGGITTVSANVSNCQSLNENLDLVEAVGMRCGPVVDILPEGDCIACFALSRYQRIPLPSAGTRTDLISEFDNGLERILPMGVHRECARCGYLAKDMCGGGCRARRAQRLRPNGSISLDSNIDHEYPRV